MAAKLSW